VLNENGDILRISFRFLELVMQRQWKLGRPRELMDKKDQGRPRVALNFAKSGC
jgi:hypothetical protein